VGACYAEDTGGECFCALGFEREVLMRGWVGGAFEVSVAG
jgi:hypothetical protein